MQTARGDRSLATAILYLVDEENPSRFHRLAFDEMWFFHNGSPVKMVMLDDPASAPRLAVLDGDHPQILVPGGVWMAAGVHGDGWTLVSCVVTPGFEYEDFERADPQALLKEFPEAVEVITAFG